MATAIAEAKDVTCGGPALPDAEPEGELFEVFDELGTLVGLERRGVVHAKGLLHKAVYCFVFDRKSRLLLQQRSAEKRIGAGQWDLSVAEHLSPGETFRQAAERGLFEELGITARLEGLALGPGTHLRRLEVPGSFYDNELVESYRLDGFEGEVRFNPSEVQAVKFASLPELRSSMEQQPQAFTQWFREELALLWDCLHGTETPEPRLLT